MKVTNDVIGDVTWGTHVCQFYQTKEDLTDILVPFFQAGLENNEFCLWITAEFLDENEIRRTMTKNLPQFDHYLRIGQIEIISYTRWYLTNGVFDQNRALDAWIDKLDQALVKGYKGMRATADIAPLIERDWERLVDYETRLNDCIGKYRMIRVCTYPLEKCRSSEVVNVIRTHQFMLTKSADEWEYLDINSMRKSKTVVISGYESFTIDIVAQSGLDYFCIDLELDPVDFEIVDFACTEVGCLGERILHDALLGYKAEEGIKNAIDQVEKRLFCSFKSGIVDALENANRWYKKIKDDGKCFGKRAVYY